MVRSGQVKSELEKESVPRVSSEASRTQGLSEHLNVYMLMYFANKSEAYRSRLPGSHIQPEIDL